MLPSRRGVRSPRRQRAAAARGGSPEVWRHGLGGDRDILPRGVITPRLSVPNAERGFYLRHGLRAGFSIEELFQLTKIDRWFLTQIREIMDLEEELAATKN